MAKANALLATAVAACLATQAHALCTPEAKTRLQVLSEGRTHKTGDYRVDYQNHNEYHRLRTQLLGEGLCTKLIQSLDERSVAIKIDEAFDDLYHAITEEYHDTMNYYFRDLAFALGEVKKTQEYPHVNGKFQNFYTTSQLRFSDAIDSLLHAVTKELRRTASADIESISLQQLYGIKLTIVEINNSPHVKNKAPLADVGDNMVQLATTLQERLLEETHNVSETPEQGERQRKLLKTLSADFFDYGTQLRLESQ